MTLFVTVLHILVCVVLIVVVLLQRGKGAEMGAILGGGGGNTVFGARGAGNFLTRLTTGAAVVFMFTSLILAYFARESADSTLFEDVPAVVQPGGEEGEAGGFEEAPGDATTGGFDEVAPSAESEASTDAEPAAENQAETESPEPAEAPTP
ncbi:MAG: preprotein translocase subunit SecG [Deltaproteobacteria bacterium]|nr:preprotein translocase subunit SecG [Deltaproteobacteria bacterium]MBW2393597.1 preprotein translocase subunit SecG [Deltaproteobacteria bacterium]